MVWNFKNLVMQFNYKGKAVELRSNDQFKMEQVSVKQIGKTLQQAKQGFLAQLSCLFGMTMQAQVRKQVSSLLQ